MARPTIDRFLAYLDASPTPHHAVQTAVAQLQERGFEEVPLAGAPRPLPTGFLGYVRKSGSLVAFRVGAQPVVEAGFRIIAAHTDSPNLRIKPQPLIRSHGYVRLGVEVYGGVTVATWPDRDLGIAGRVTLRHEGGLRHALVNLDRPLCRIPNLAIHLNRKVNDEGLKLNKQTHLPAVFALDDGDDGDPLRALLAAELGASADDVLTWDLSLYDLTPAAISGANGEFVHSARLDNLASCHAALEALLESESRALPASTAVIALFDHEEIGSQTVRGANSRLLGDVLKYIRSNGEARAPGSLARALEHSWLVSADMAHAVHPGYAGQHDEQHMPKLNAGPVIKQNANYRYTTDDETAARFLVLCESVDAPCQWFVNRTDLACGSTVGPMLAARLGVRSIDVGNPMLSMHSAREMCGSRDHPWMIAVMTEVLGSDLSR